MRLARQWTARELERRAGIGQGVVARIERRGLGNTTFVVVTKLAEVLHVTLDHLAGRDDG